MKTKRKIRLFVDAHCFDREYQGTRTFVQGLYTSMMNLYGSDFDLFFGARDVGKVSAIFPDANILPYGKTGGGLGRFFIDIPRYVREYKFDFAHFQNLSMARQNGCQSIVTLHDIIFRDYPGDFPFFYRKTREYLFKRSIAAAAIKTSVSAYSRERISSQFLIDPGEIHVIPNGARWPSEDKPSPPRQARANMLKKFGFDNFILCVSRIEPRKNHLLLLKTYTKLGLYNSGIHLVFVGKKSLDVPQLEGFAGSLPARQREMVHWIDQVSQEDLIDLYRACRLFVYPSRAEGFGIPPLEAIGCGAPVLCSNAAAMREYDFFEPHRFDPEDEPEFENKFLRAIESPPGESFIKNAQFEASARYSWNRSAALFFNLMNTSRT
ncbi:MAG TPA: glycosyltransferase family 1 protein [Puia sp.]|nr:glycosyltransferase family 1 protein [Puia sp.]